MSVCSHKLHPRDMTEYKCLVSVFNRNSYIDKRIFYGHGTRLPGFSGCLTEASCPNKAYYV